MILSSAGWDSTNSCLICRLELVNRRWREASLMAARNDERPVWVYVIFRKNHCSGHEKMTVNMSFDGPVFWNRQVAYIYCCSCHFREHEVTLSFFYPWLSSTNGWHSARTMQKATPFWEKNIVSMRFICESYTCWPSALSSVQPIVSFTPTNTPINRSECKIAVYWESLAQFFPFQNSSQIRIRSIFSDYVPNLRRVEIGTALLLYSLGRLSAKLNPAYGLMSTLQCFFYFSVLQTFDVLKTRSVIAVVFRKQNLWSLFKNASLAFDNCLWNRN